MKRVAKNLLLINSLLLLFINISCNTEDVKPFTPTLGSFLVSKKQIGVAPFNVTAPTSNSSGTFTYISSNDLVATVSGNIVTVVGIGTTTITAIQSANAGYGEATISTTFEVTEFEPPTIGTFYVPTKILGNASFVLTPPISNSSGTFTYTSSNLNVATINGNSLTIVGVGTSIITATQAAFGSFSSGNIAATFTVTAELPTAANIASDNFDALSGSALTDKGWIAHSSIGANPILITSPGLTFPNYYGSGIGNAAALTSTGQDVSLQFTSVNAGTIYASFLVNATASPLCVDQYFFAFGNNTITDTAYRGKLLINQDPINTSKFKFGFAANLSNKYSTNFFDYGTTYLVVIKYKIIDAAVQNTNGNIGRDETSLYIFEANGNFLTEPTSPTIGFEDTASADIIPGRVVFRQDNTNSPNVIIDGLRIDSTWNLRN